ncbi:hypothetical protein GQ600_12140 [Phytophthora cactorum]|nr:hypothetical protein GQ600_12140 [Phytophthora cactorum]
MSEDQAGGSADVLQPDAESPSTVATPTAPSEASESYSGTGESSASPEKTPSPDSSDGVPFHEPFGSDDDDLTLSDLAHLWKTVPRKEQDITTRVRKVLEHFVDPADARLEERVFDEVRTVYETEADCMRVKILQRNSPCRECREISSENGRKLDVKRVRYDCSSLTAHRSGAHSSTSEGNGPYGYVSVIADADRKSRRKPGLRELPEPLTLTALLEPSAL